MQHNVEGHLAAAREYLTIAESGDAELAAYEHAADEIIAALDEDPALTLAEVDRRLGRAARRGAYSGKLVKWRRNPRRGASPFADPNDPHKRSATKDGERIARDAPALVVADVVRTALAREDVREQLAANDEAAEALHAASSDVYQREDRRAGHDRSKAIRPAGQPGLERTMGELELKVAGHKLVQLAQRLGLEEYLLALMEEWRERLELSLAAGDPKQAVAELEQWLATQGEER